MPGSRRLSPAERLADTPAMWTYVLRHRLLLRAIYARSAPLA
ncbi:MAG: hypothetical protein WAT39_19010 [Planctomycetota bacterium]